MNIQTDARQNVCTMVWVTGMRHDALYAARKHEHNTNDERLTL
jgi:hypothetical protein